MQQIGGTPSMKNFSSWSNRRVAKENECELNEEVGPDQGISFLQGEPEPHSRDPRRYRVEDSPTRDGP